MKEEYVTYEQAIKLKELGFDERTTYEYSEIVEGSGREEWDEDEQRMMFIEDINYYPKLRLDQAQKWLRDKWRIHVEPNFIYETKFEVVIKRQKGSIFKRAERQFDSYEESLSFGIDAARELLTDNQNDK